MKKLGLIIFASILIGGGYYFYHKYSPSARSAPSIDYPQVMKEAASAPINASEEIKSQPTSLTSMLEAGINTEQGILISNKVSKGNLDKYSLLLNNKPLGIEAVSEMELVKAFLIDNKQVLLFSYNQGGNQCGKQYQILTLSSEGYKISNIFGSCLPLSKIEEASNSLIFMMPQNNPYLGQDVLVSYKYVNGQVALLAKPDAKDLKQKYAKYTATDILKIAEKDGCYVGGVLLDDNSCGGGRKYCVMFKNISSPEKSDDYKTLHDFCAQP